MIYNGYDRTNVDLLQVSFGVELSHLRFAERREHHRGVAGFARADVVEGRGSWKRVVVVWSRDLCCHPGGCVCRLGGWKGDSVGRAGVRSDTGTSILYPFLQQHL